MTTSPKTAITFPSKLQPLQKRDRAQYGVERAKDAAFDAVTSLWRRREAEGLLQKDLAERIGRDPGWVCRALRGPGNWTLKTIGEFVEGLGGELEMKVYAIEDAIHPTPNFHAYVDYPEPALIDDSEDDSDQELQTFDFTAPRPFSTKQDDQDSDHPYETA